MKEIKLRVNDDIHNKLKREADINKCFISELIRSILSSWTNGCEKTVNIITRKIDEKNNWKKMLKERFVMTSKLINEYNDFAMNIIVRMEEYNIPKEEIDKDIEIMINALNDEIKNAEKFKKDYNILTTLKLRFEDRNFGAIKKNINYDERRMRWIINKKIKPDKIELHVLINRVEEIKSKERVVNERK